MWAEIVKEMADFESAVLAGVDDSGYPYSIRCKPEPDAGEQVLRMRLPDSARLQSGPAALLYHRHDESLWNLKSFISRGTLERDPRGWLFRPQQFTPGAGIGGPMGMVKFVQDGRRSTRQYLEKRRLSRPAIAWDSIHALWAEAHNKHS